MMLVVHSNGLSVRTVTCGARQLWSTRGTHSARLQDQADQAGQQAAGQPVRAAVRPRAGARRMAGAQQVQQAQQAQQAPPHCHAAGSLLATVGRRGPPVARQGRLGTCCARSGRGDLVGRAHDRAETERVAVEVPL